MDISDAIKSRRSIRKFKKIKIEISEIIEILNLTIWAPSAHNSMPYYFLIIDDSDIKLELVNKINILGSFSFI